MDSDNQIIIYQGEDGETRVCRPTTLSYLAQAEKSAHKIIQELFNLQDETALLKKSSTSEKILQHLI